MTKTELKSKVKKIERAAIVLYNLSWDLKKEFNEIDNAEDLHNLANELDVLLVNLKDDLREEGAL